MAINTYGAGKAGDRQKPAEKLEKATTDQLPLGRNNFRWMGVAAVMIVAGFLLMLGSGSTSEAFNPDIFSVRRIVIGPTVAFLGFIAMGVAVIVRPRQKNEDK